jgi:PilZ domain
LRELKLRGHERVPHMRDVSVHAPAHGDPVGAYSIDLSRSGSKIFSVLPLAVGDEVKITWGDRVPAVTLGGRVAYVASTSDGQFAGVQFHRSLSPEAFRALREHRDTAAYLHGHKGRA